MAKSKFDSNELVKFLTSKWKNTPCPMCHVGSFNVSDTIYELREFNQGALVIGGAPIIPVIPIICNNCGNTVLVNALLSGAIEAPKKEGDKDNAK